MLIEKLVWLSAAPLLKPRIPNVTKAKLKREAAILTTYTSRLQGNIDVMTPCCQFDRALLGLTSGRSAARIARPLQRRVR